MKYKQKQKNQPQTCWHVSYLYNTCAQKYLTSWKIFWKPFCYLRKVLSPRVAGPFFFSQPHWLLSPWSSSFKLSTWQFLLGPSEVSQALNSIISSSGSEQPSSPTGTDLSLTSLDRNSTSEVATTTNADQAHSACIYYNILDSVSRNAATLEADSVCKSESNGNPCCDNKGHNSVSPDWKGEGWYRYVSLHSSWCLFWWWWFGGAYTLHVFL